jgi:hypothetical protein
MSFTAVSVISLGVMLAYGSVIGVLHAFAYSQSQQQQRTSPKLAFVAGQNPR